MCFICNVYWFKCSLEFSRYFCSKFVLSSRGFEGVVFTHHIHNFWGSLLFLGKSICLLEDNSVGPFLFFRFVLGNSVSDCCLISSNSLQYSTIAKLIFSPSLDGTEWRHVYSFPECMISLVNSKILMDLVKVFFCWLNFERCLEF